MKKLTLRLLGVPEIRVDDRLLHFPTRKAQALLIYLAVEGGLHSRSRLTNLLWAESSAKLGRAAFRNTLARLQRTLNNPHWLFVQGDLIGLRYDELIQVDVADITKLAAQADDVDAITGITLLKGINGDFLDGFTVDDAIGFDDWVSLKREYYHRIIDELFERLSRRSADTSTILMWIRHNPISERAYRRLIELYLETGDRSAALDTYETYCATLKTELGLEPSAEIRMLVEATNSAFALHLSDRQLDGLEMAMTLIADDAIFINPLGYYAGKANIYQNLKEIVGRCMQFHLWNFRVMGGCVIYSYQVKQGDSLVLDAFDDGATIVRHGKIIFDGTLRSVPAHLLTLAYSFAGESNAVEIVKAYYRELKAEVSP